MRGIVYLNVEKELGFRTQEFLDNNPMFVAENHEFILKAWRFDPEDIDLVRRMLQDMSNLRLVEREVRDMCVSLGVDLSKIRKTA